MWGTLVAAAIALLAFYGPREVLLPYVVKNELGGSAADLGLVFLLGGAGSLVASLVMGQRPLPKRFVTFMYVSWTVATGALIVYGLAGTVWQLLVASFVWGAAASAGMIVWATTMQREVPSQLLGRVTSLDWLVSVSLIPVSFALTGPVAGVAGTTATLVGAGAIGAALTAGFLFLPGMRDLERRSSETEEAGCCGGSSSG